MKIRLLILTVLVPILAMAQISFRTIVPNGWEAGKSFSVQYVLEGASQVDQFDIPEFGALRMIGSPRPTKGASHGEHGVRPIYNTQIVLVAEQPGIYTVPGARVTVDGKTFQSLPAKLRIGKPGDYNTVKQQQLPFNDGYYLAPGEDPQVKIKNNLYVKVQVNKKTCYVGEPVVATFKMYSRLDSKSDIVKNPGFYGFTVQDMVNLADKQMVQEVINGKKFDVHTVRKVQLYPLQAGTFMIDPMEVMNAVSFSRSVVNKKTEQEITEGIYATPPEPETKDKAEFHSTMHTEPVTITVKPVPAQQQPEDFAGAAGRFKVRAAVDRVSLARNEEGTLRLTIEGKGNFTQLSAPSINWPAGIDGFAPSVTDSLDIQQAPLTGSRTFRYRFVSAKSGSYHIPAFSFSFFDPDTNRYKSVSTAALDIVIEDRDKPLADTSAIQAKNAAGNLPINPAYVWLVVIVCGVVAGAFFTWRRETKRSREAAIKLAATPKPKTPLSIFLQQAEVLTGGDNRAFYASLRQAVWSFFADRFKVDGSRMNKRYVDGLLAERNVPGEVKMELQDILDHCEAGLFTTADTTTDNNELFDRTRRVLGTIDEITT